MTNEAVKVPNCGSVQHIETHLMFLQQRLQKSDAQKVRFSRQESRNRWTEDIYDVIYESGPAPILVINHIMLVYTYSSSDISI